VPEAAVAVFVGTEFDSITGRGGEDGTPLRKTPWALYHEARQLLAWEDIQDEASDLKLDETQRRQLSENTGKARRDLREAVWRTYKTVMLLGKDNAVRTVDLGLVHSSAADSLVGFIVNRLKQDGDISDGISPKFLVRNWSGAHKEWSTKAVKDAVFASPLFPRLLNPDLIREHHCERGQQQHPGVRRQEGWGRIRSFPVGVSMTPQEVEISDDVFVITADTAQAHKDAAIAPKADTGPGLLFTETGGQSAAATAGASGGQKSPVAELDDGADVRPEQPKSLRWTGDIPPQKWMNFYTKVLSRFVTGKGLRLSVTVDASPEGGVSSQTVQETKTALRELGLQDDVRS
jgi:hypothetical protein